jgi:hypothetical protein
MKTVTVTTFEVSDVVRANQPLPEVPYKEAIEALLTTADPDGADEWDDKNDFLDDRPESAPPRPVEACARYHGRLVGRVAFHPFVAAIHRAFKDHRPLCLSPDMIWLLICQGVANHINGHAEELRPRLVPHRGQATLAVRRDDFVKGSPENPWPEVFSDLSAQIRGHIGPAIDRFLPHFTTTGPVERAAAEVVLLETMRSYFAYEVHTRCGIPAITLEGTSEDWRAVAQRARSFGDLGLGWWIDPLGAVLDQFARASRGDVDRPFWRSLYKLHDESGGPKVTGWVLTLFPYLKDWRTGRATMRNPWLTEELQPIRYDDIDFDDIEVVDIESDEIDEDDGKKIDFDDLRQDDIEGNKEAGEPDYEPDGPTIEQFPGGLSSAPFRWEYPDRTFDMDFLGGFVGVAQDPETLALRPEIGWAVREAGETA